MQEKISKSTERPDPMLQVSDAALTSCCEFINHALFELRAALYASGPQGHQLGLASSNYLFAA